MINSIREYTKENYDTTPLILIYDKLRNRYNEHDIKFTLLTFFDYDVDLELKLSTEEREKRDYQRLLRQQAFERYNNRCIISGIDEDILLEVAHIKPVSRCDTVIEKADVDNTLLLWIDIHKYFDAYKISINPKTCRVVVKCDYLMKYNDLYLELNDSTRKYLEHHYSIFLGSTF